MAGFVAAGCNDAGDSRHPSDDPTSASKRRDEAVDATDKAARSVRDYTYAQKDEFIESANRELAELRAEKDRLRDLVDQSTGEARAEAEARLDVVSERWADARARLDDAEAATEASWGDVQNRYRTARADLKSSVDDARQWLSERIEP